MAKPNISIGAIGDAGGVSSVARRALLGLRLTGNPHTALYRALAASVILVAVSIPLMWSGAKTEQGYVAFAGLAAFVVAEVIWIILIGVLGWKLSVMVLNDYRAGRSGTPKRGKTGTQ